MQHDDGDFATAHAKGCEGLQLVAQAHALGVRGLGRLTWSGGDEEEANGWEEKQSEEESGQGKDVDEATEQTCR